MDDTPTILPFIFNISGRAYLVQYTVPQKFTSINDFKTLTSASLKSARIEMPALLMRISILPKVRTACFTSCSQSSSLVTSQPTATALMLYCCCKDCAILHKVTYWRAPNTRLQPRRANSSANDLPMPDEAPVIITILSFNFIGSRVHLQAFYFYFRQFKQVLG